MKLIPSLRLYGMLIAALIAIAIIVSAFVVLAFTKDFFYQHELTERKQVLADKAEVVGQQILFYRNIAKKLAKKQIVSDILVFRDQGEALRWSANQRRRLPYTVGAALFTKNGRILGDSRRQNISAACIAAARKLLRGKSISRPTIHHHRNGQGHFGLMAPVREEGKLIGLVFISISLDSLRESLKHLTKPGMSLWLHENTGKTILHLGERNKQKDITQLSIAIPGTDWVLDLFQAKPKLDEVYIAFGSITALVVIIVMALVLVLMTFAVRAVTGEFNTIQGLLQSIVRGQTPENPPVPRIREVAAVMPAIERIAREIHDNQNELKALSLTDELTGMPNRRHFQETLDRAIGLAKRGMPVCVGLIDIDHFKRVNDTSGHDIGDQVLCVLAAVLRQHTRASDFAARLGGDEFAVILYEMERSDARDWFERVRKEMTAHTREKGLCNTDWPCTLSCGFTYIDSSQDIDTSNVLRKADKALYQGKERGRNRVVGI